MRAVTLMGYGDPGVLSVSDLPDPRPGPGEVRIRTACAAVNPVDIGTRSGSAAAAIPDPTFPMVLGWDVAGVVDAVGDGVERFAVGDRVIAMSLWFVTRVGTYAELVVLGEDASAKAPEGIDDAAASTIPLNGLTAWSALAVAHAEPGDRVLVTGAGGGVGRYLVQLAASRGLSVVGLARTSDLDTIRELGASDAVDDLDGVSGIRVAIDTTANPDLALGCVESGGRLLYLSGKPSQEREGVTAKRVGVRTDARALDELSGMASRGALTLLVHGVFPFEQAGQAQTTFARGGVRGRIVLQPSL